MDESEAKKENRNGQKHRFDQELLKKGLRCDLDQYNLLKRCSEKKDMTEWNEWRKENLDEDVLLEGVDLSHRVIKDTNFIHAKFKSANFMDSDLRGSCFIHSNLDGANFEDAKLQHTLLSCASLKGANFTLASVDGETVIWKPKVSRYSKKNKFTDFTGVSLDTVRIDPGTKQLLEYNIRRMNWEDWYKEYPKLKWLVKPFWWVSDYGISTCQIITCFFILAVVFASIFYLWGLIEPPGILDYLFVDGDGVRVADWLVPLRAIHFSIVVMTVGFTNIYANAHSVWAHVLVGLQMILGFVLLGALVTRFAVLFTAGGPAGKFAEGKIATEDTENTEIKNN